MNNFIKDLLSTNSQSSMRLALLIGLLLTVAITICVLIIAFKHSVWNIDITVIDKLSDFAFYIIVPLVLGKVIQKFAENVGDKNKEEIK